MGWHPTAAGEDPQRNDRRYFGRGFCGAGR
jgi:hypothetical protein